MFPLSQVTLAVEYRLSVACTARRVDGLPTSSRESARVMLRRQCDPGSLRPGDQLRLATEQVKLGALCSDWIVVQNGVQILHVAQK